MHGHPDTVEPPSVKAAVRAEIERALPAGWGGPPLAAPLPPLVAAYRAQDWPAYRALRRLQAQQRAEARAWERLLRRVGRARG